MLELINTFDEATSQKINEENVASENFKSSDIG